MKPAPFEYFRPRSLQEALELLATYEGAKVLAGGQSLMAMMNMRFVQPDQIVDVNKLDLAYIRLEGGVLVIGAATRQRDIELSPVVRQNAPLICEALSHVGHVQTRNRGTIGGSLCHLDPAAELPAVAMTLDAELVISSTKGTRVLPMRDFALGYMTTALEPGELLTEVRIPCLGAGHGYAFEEFARRHGDFAVASAAVAMTVSAGTVATVAVTIGGLDAVPRRIPEAEQLLCGQRVDQLPIEAAATLCGNVDAIADAHATAEYRQHLATVLASRALHRAARRTSQESQG